MASASCVTSNGVYSRAAPFKIASANCVTACGVASAASRVSWAGSSAPKSKADWLPRADEAWFDPKTGRPTPRFYQFMREVAEVRLGGIRGQSVVEVSSTVTQTQAEVAATSNFAEQVNQYAQSVAATAAATAEVAANNSLSGATSIPEPADPVDRYASRYGT